MKSQGKCRGPGILTSVAINTNATHIRGGYTVPSILVAHPTGNQYVRNAVRSLVEHDMLAEFWTTIVWNLNSPLNLFLPRSVRIQLARRSFVDVPREFVHSVPWRESVRLSSRLFSVDQWIESGEGPFSVIGMFRDFDAKVARRLREKAVSAVYSHEGGALQTFREAKRLGIPTMYELPSSFWYWEHQLLSEEAARYPEFAGLLPKLKDSRAHMTAKDEEIGLADYVFVPSEHVRHTLAGVVPDEKIRVINYGAPPVRSQKKVSTDRSVPLKVLFAGGLNQRKGIGYVLDAIEQLGSIVELTLLGRRFGTNQRVNEACNRWRWFETLPHSGVMDLMQESDVLVLPSLAEGCALVVLEALSCGLPVIVTPNTGSLEFVREGREGFVVPICDSGAIADRLMTLNNNRELLVEMSRHALETAEKKSWLNYRDKWVNAVRLATCR